MSQVRRNSKSIAALLRALVVFAMWSNAMAGIFCPHMSGGRDCCLLQALHVHPNASVSGAFAETDHKQMNHEQMSDMDMQDGSMDMSDTQTADVADSQQRLDISLADTEKSQTSSNEPAVTQPNEPCSHCMMHSRSGERFPVSIVQNSTSYQIIAADTSTEMLNAVSSPLTFVELHDHGPPGSSAPLYVLVSAFRI